MSDHSPTLDAAQQLLGSCTAQLRDLAARARTEAEARAADMRAAERYLDEALTRARSIPGSASRQKIAELRQQCEALNAATEHSRHAVRQIDQLVRQIEMSSGSLATSGEPASNDPWALALRGQAIHGREQERARLAREVHDGPAQVLANSMMLIESSIGAAQQNNTERLLLMLDRLKMASREGLDELRRFIADLRPGKLEEQGLVAGLRELTGRYTDRYGMRLVAEIEDLPTFSSETEIVLYRVAQEALQNAHKYARGAPTLLRLGQEGNEVRLLVRDDGPGFDPREVARRTGKTNWGFTSMRERAELIGATFTVASRPGHGTEVLVRLSSA